MKGRIYIWGLVCLIPLLSMPLQAQEKSSILLTDKGETENVAQKKEYAAFKKGDNDLSLTGGLYGLAAFQPVFYPQGTLSYEQCVADGLTKSNKGSIGLGFNLGCGLVEGMVLYAPIAFRASYHHQVLPKLDLYGSLNVGVGLIYACFNNDGKGSKCDWSTSFTGGAYGGIHYFITKWFALKAEAGLGVSFLSLGVNFRF